MSVREHPDSSQPAVEYNLPYSFYADWLQYDLDDVLRRYQRPSLFIAGADDALITPTVVYNVYSIAAHPKSYAEVASDHDYRHHPHIIRQINHMISGFVETIGRG